MFFLNRSVTSHYSPYTHYIPRIYAVYTQYIPSKKKNSLHPLHDIPIFSAHLLRRRPSVGDSRWQWAMCVLDTLDQRQVKACYDRLGLGRLVTPKLLI